MSLFSRINTRVKEAVISSGKAIKQGTCGEGRQNKARKQWFSGRSLRLEPLEDRQLLSVTAVDYEELELNVPIMIHEDIFPSETETNITIANNLTGPVAESATPNITSTSSTAVATPNEYYADGTITGNKAQPDYKSVKGDFDYNLERTESEQYNTWLHNRHDHYYLSKTDHMETAAEMLWISGWAQAAGFPDAESVLTHIKANFEESYDAYPEEMIEWFITGNFSRIDKRWYNDHIDWISKTNADGGGFFQEVNYDSIGGYYNAFNGPNSADGKDCGYMGQAFIALDAGTAVSAELQFVGITNDKAWFRGFGHAEGVMGTSSWRSSQKDVYFPNREHDNRAQGLTDKTTLVVKELFILPYDRVSDPTDTRHYGAIMFANDDYNVISPNYDDEDPREDHIEKDVWYLVEWNDSLQCYTFAVEPDWYKSYTAADNGASFRALNNSDMLFRTFWEGNNADSIAALENKGEFRYFIERSQFSTTNNTPTPNRWGDEYIGGFDGVNYGFNATAGQVKPFFVNLAFTGLEFLANYSAKISPYALDDTFSLQSYKGSENVVYLDFTTIGLDSHRETASFQERIWIQEIWQRVAEDFMPFNVNITTDASVQGTGYHITVSIGTQLTDQYLPQNLQGTPPSASESDMTLNVTLEKSAAEMVSRAIGGLLGLSSDAYLLNTEYPGREKWGPIMGNSESVAKQYTQWSQGEYATAEGAQDEVAILASRLGYRIDDFGNTIESAQDLSDFLVDVYWQYDPLISLYENYNEWKNQYAKVEKYSSSQGTYLVSGVIGRSEDENGNWIYDQDVFSFVSSGGSYVIDVSGLGADMRWNSMGKDAWKNSLDYYYAFDWWMTNLNIKVELLNSRGEIIQFYDPLMTSFVHFTTDPLTEGETYYIKVYGIGEGNALTNGFSDYGSMGSYTLSVQENLENFVVREDNGTSLKTSDPYYNAIVVTTLEDIVAMDGQISLREALSYIGRRLEDGSFVGTTIVFSADLLSTDKTFYFGNDNNGEYRGELYLNYELSGKITTLDAQYFYDFATKSRVLTGEDGVPVDSGANITIDARLKLEDGTIQDASGRVLQVDNITAEIRGFVITGGNATTDSDFPDVTDQYGGGVYNNYGWLTLKDSIIAGNSALKGGGGIYNTAGYAPLYYPMMSGNEYNFNDSFGTLTIINSEIIGNRTTYNGNVSSSSIGGGIFNFFTAELFMYNCTVAGNLSVWSGGGLENNGRAEIYNSIFSNNYADRGTDIYTEKDAFNNNGYTNVYYSLIRDRSIDNDYDTYNYGSNNGQALAIGTETKAGTRTNPLDPNFLVYKDYAVYKINTEYLAYGIVSPILDADKIKWSPDLWKDWNLALNASSIAIDMGNNAYYTENEAVINKWTNYWNTWEQKNREDYWRDQYETQWNADWDTTYGQEFGTALDDLLLIDPTQYFNALSDLDKAIDDLNIGINSLAEFLPTLGANGLVVIKGIDSFQYTVDIGSPVKLCLALNGEYAIQIKDLLNNEFANTITARIQSAINAFIATDKAKDVNAYNTRRENLNRLFRTYVWNSETDAYYTNFTEFLARQGNSYKDGFQDYTGTLRFTDKTDNTKTVSYDISTSDKFYTVRTTAANSSYFKDIDLCILTGIPQEGTVQAFKNMNNATEGITDTYGTLWGALTTAITVFTAENDYAGELNNLDNLYIRMFGNQSGFGEFLVENSPLNEVAFTDPQTAPQIFYEENSDDLRTALAGKIKEKSVIGSLYISLQTAFVNENVDKDRQTEVAALIIEHEAKYDLGRKTRIVGMSIDAGAFEYQGTEDPITSSADFSEYTPKTTVSDTEYDWSSSAIASKTKGDRLGFGVSGTETRDGDTDIRTEFTLEPDTTSNVIGNDEEVYLNFSFINLDGATVGQDVLEKALDELLHASTTNTTEYDTALNNCNITFMELLNGMNFEDYLTKVGSLGSAKVDISTPAKLHAAYINGKVTLNSLLGQFFQDGLVLFENSLNNWLNVVSLDASDELDVLENLYEAWLGSDFTTYLGQLNMGIGNGKIIIRDLERANYLVADISTPDKFRSLVLDWTKQANSSDEKTAEFWTENLNILMDYYSNILLDTINNVSTNATISLIGWKTKLAYCLANNTGVGDEGFFVSDASWAVAIEKMDSLYTAWFGKDLNTFLAGRTLDGVDIGDSVKLYNVLKNDQNKIDAYNALVIEEISDAGNLPFNTYVNFTRTKVTSATETTPQAESMFVIMISPSYAKSGTESVLTIASSTESMFGGHKLLINDDPAGSIAINGSGNLTVNGEIVGKITYKVNGLVTIEDLKLGTLDLGAYLYMMELNPDSTSSYLPTEIPNYVRIPEIYYTNNKSYVKVQVAEKLDSDPIVVTTESDVNDPFDGKTSLREAIRAAGSQYSKEYEIKSGNYVQLTGTEDVDGAIYYVEGDKVYNVEKGDYLRPVENEKETDDILDIANGTSLYLYEDTVILLQIKGTAPVEARYGEGTRFTYNAADNIFVMEDGTEYKFMEGTKLVLNSVHIGTDFWYHWTGQKMTEIVIPEDTPIDSTFTILENLTAYDKNANPVTFNQNTAGFYIRTGTQDLYNYKILDNADKVSVAAGETVFVLDENSVRKSVTLDADLDLKWMNGYWKDVDSDTLYALRKGTNVTYNTVVGTYETTKTEKISPINGDLLVSADQKIVHAYYDDVDNKFYTTTADGNKEEYKPSKSLTYAIKRITLPTSDDQTLTYKDRNILKQASTLGTVILFDAKIFNDADKVIDLVAENGTIFVDKSITIDASQFVEWNDETKTWDPAVSTDRHVVVNGQDAIQLFVFGSNKMTDTKITINNLDLQNGLAEFLYAENGIDIIGGGNGGAIENYGSLILNNCSIKNNVARQYGGGVYSVGSLAMNDCIVEDNRIDVGYEKYNIYPEAYGAGVYSRTDHTLLIDNVSFINNQIILDYQNVNINVKAGGVGLYSEGTTIITGRMSDTEGDRTVFQGNEVSVKPIDPNMDASGTLTGYGAGLAVFGDLELTKVDFISNQFKKGVDIVNTLYGGAIYINGDAVITDVTASRNAAMIGGGIAAEGGRLDLSDSDISSNTGELFGAGLYTTSIAVLDQMIINDNKLEIYCLDTEEDKWQRTIGGAGVYSVVNDVSKLDPNDSAVLKIFNSKIDENEVSVTIDPDFGYGVDITIRGGAVYVENGSEIVGTSVSGNTITVDLGDFDQDSIINVDISGTGIYNEYTLDPETSGSVSLNTIVSGSNIQENTAVIRSTQDLSKFISATNEIIKVKGSGLYRKGSSDAKTALYIDNTRISGNYAIFQNVDTKTALGLGGGAYLLNESAYVSNTVLGMNAASKGAAFYNEEGTLTLINTTVGVNGVSDEIGGSIYNNGTLALFNSIIAQTRDTSGWWDEANPLLGDARQDLYNNEEGEEGEEESEKSRVAISYSLIGWAENTEDWTLEGTCFVGSEEKTFDPSFDVDLNENFNSIQVNILAADGLRLTEESFVIDVGRNEDAVQMTPNGQIPLVYDIQGNARILDDVPLLEQIYVPIVDFGAYEFNAIVYRDLAFIDIDPITIEPETPSTATEITVSFTGKNNGPGTIFNSFDYVIHLYKEINGEYVEINKGQYIGTYECSSSKPIAGGDTFDVSDFSLGYLSAGDYKIRIYLDEMDVILESNKENNWSSEDIESAELFEVKLSNDFIVNTELDLVDPDDGMTSLREAILFANTGRIEGGVANITFSEDLKGKTLYLTQGQISIAYNNETFDGQHLTSFNIDASSIGGITIDAQNMSRIFSISNDITDPAITPTGGVTFNSITFQNGDALKMESGISPLQGGAINNAYNLTIENCTFINNTAKDGSAIRNVGNLTVLNSVIKENTAEGNGAIFNGGTDGIGSATIISTVISGNDSGTGYGGAVAHQGSNLLIQDSDLSGNSAGFGGGVALLKGAITIENSTIVGNYAKGNSASIGIGGGIFSIVNFSLTDSIVIGNKAGQDPNIYIKRGTQSGTNNLTDADPITLFQSFESYETWTKDLYKGWNLQLSETATDAIDKGTTTRAADAVDAAGNPRIFNTVIDIGAYEYQPVNIVTTESGSKITVVSTGGKIDKNTEITTFEVRTSKRPGSVSYSIKSDIESNEEDANFVLDAISGKLTAAKDLNDGEYKIIIIATVDGVACEETEFTINIAPQLAPSAIVDSHLITSTSVSLIWNAVENADQYRIRYKKINDASDAWTIYQDTKGKSFFTGTMATVSASFEIGSTYIFQIQAWSKDNYIASEWSDQEKEIVAASAIPFGNDLNPDLLRWSSKQMVTIEYILPTISVKSYEFLDGQILKLVFNVSMNSEGCISEWKINWGDENGVQSVSYTGTRWSSSHYYKDNGDFSITLELLDSKGYGSNFVYGLGTHIVNSHVVQSEVPNAEPIVLVSDPVVVTMESPLPDGSNYVQDNAKAFESLFGLRKESDSATTSSNAPIAASILPDFHADRLSNRILRQHINRSIDSIYADERLDLAVIDEYGFEEAIVSENDQSETSIYDELLTELN